MELKSANLGANWHPLTSLITFESLEEHRVRYFMPILDGTPDYFSTLMHEITHLTSARFGRFGLYLARIAAREYVKWQGDRTVSLSLSQNERRVLGAYVPLLEGLALYTQLDFEGEESEGPHYSPLYLIANMAMANHVLARSLPERFRLWRGEAMAGENVSLLEGLLLDRTSEDLNYYTFGYLYVKALQAQWAQRCPAFARPAVFLPFAIKFLTEHPVLISAELVNLTTEQILSAIHQTLTGLSADDLGFLNNLFSEQQTLSEFDHCDIYRQLETRSTDQIWKHDEDYVSPFANDTDDQTFTWMLNLRACNGVYLYSWCEGVLRLSGDSVYDAVLEDAQGTSEAHLVTHAGIWHSAWEETIKNEKDEQTQALQADVGNFLLNMETKFFEALEAAEGKHVCLAGFITIFRSIPGLCLWVEGEYVECLISEPWHLLEMFKAQATDEMYFLGAGLRIPPPDRVAFAHAFTDNEAVARQTRASGEHLLTYLISEPDARLRLRQRLAGIWRGRLAEARQWAKGFPRPYPLPESLLDRAQKVFDLPGFSAGNGAQKISFERLLPTEFTSG